MQIFHHYDKPVEVHGLPYFEKDGELRRLPPEVAAGMNEWFAKSPLPRRVPGARLCFRTDAEEIKFTVTLEALNPDIGVSIFSCQSGYVYFGRGEASEYAGHFFPNGYGSDKLTFSGTFKNPHGMIDVTLWLPRNEVTKDAIVEIPDGAKIEGPSPYTYPHHVLFYGSSITEGGCCSKVPNYYNCMACRLLDVDFYNYGFSGSAKAEPAIGEFLCGVEDVSVFVMDYDHNAPDPAYLRDTHEPFFKRYRAAHPNTPVIFMSHPELGCWSEQDSDERRAIIEQTYKNALAAGDKNVYYINGADFFTGQGVRPELCTNDKCHPNDLGHYCMMKSIYPLLERLVKAK